MEDEKFDENMQVGEESNSILTTDHEICSMIVDVLKAHGVKNAVLSPGSRNAPLLMAFAREVNIKKWVIVDERSAAFVAVGLAQQSKSPVAIVCTSGSAVLNYAPAIAEAYYQRLPIVVISGDRPIEWIDQNDSQTIRQNGALSSIVKHTYDVPATYNDKAERWWVNRMINDAMTMAVREPKSPVHINVQLREPLCGEARRKADLERLVTDVAVVRRVADVEMMRLANVVTSGLKVMVVVGMCDGDENLNNALSALAELPNFVVLTENLANLNDGKFIPTIDRTLQAVPYNEREKYAPDILITFGGALVSRMIKQFLRRFTAKEHWRIGIENNLIDTMQNLTSVIDVLPTDFFLQLANSVKHITPTDSDYAKRWKTAERDAHIRHKKYVNEIGWCDLKAFSHILPSVPKGCNLQLSNGTSVRYAQLFDLPNVLKCNCNRGVAGIDGSTSTALGASFADSKHTTVLITGDMSLSYDINGMASQYNSARFKIIVMCNGGGGIFRFIKGPSDLPELEKYFEVNRDLPIDKYAAAFGFDYFKADDEKSIIKCLPKFWSNDKASILAVHTPNKENAVILRKYFHFLRQDII